MFSKLKNWWQSTDPDIRKPYGALETGVDTATKDATDFDPVITAAFGKFASYLLQVSAINSEQREIVLSQVKGNLSADSTDNLDLFVMSFCHDCPINEPLCIYIDWKAWDEIEWQLKNIAARHQLSFSGKPKWGCYGKTTPEVLQEIATWLQPKGFYLMEIETGGDDYLLFLVPQDQSKALRLALAAGLPAKVIS